MKKKQTALMMTMGLIALSASAAAPQAAGLAVPGEVVIEPPTLQALGIEIARMAHAVGMKVIATDPVKRNPPDFVSHVGLPEELPSLIGQADVGCTEPDSGAVSRRFRRPILDSISQRSA
jgi:hypothetical protein